MTRRRNASLRAGAILVAAWCAAAAGAGGIAPHDPLGIEVARALESPSAEFPLGTDALGRCVLSRVLHGARTSLSLCGTVLLLHAVLGTLLGAVAGARGGWVDLAYLGLTDLLAALPEGLVVLVVAGLAGPETARMVLVLALFGWVNLSRVARSVVLREREQGWVTASVALGAGRGHILRRALLPPVLRSAAVLLPLKAASILLAVAGLGFLGLGVQPPAPEWGSMIGEGRHVLRAAPWVVLGPSAAISSLLAAGGLLAQGLRGRLGAGEPGRA